MAEDELIDVLDAAGAVTGVKTRAQVHTDDDWHGLVFTWSAWVEGTQVMMMLQRRGGADDHPPDPFAGQVDALAGGHMGTGESPAACAVRELAEEVGLEIPAADLIELGTMRMERPGAACRRVIEHLLLYPTPVSIEALSCSDEVDGFVQVTLHDLADLIHGRRDHVKVRCRRGDDIAIEDLPRAALSAYPPEILEVFRRSLVAIDHYLQQGEVNPGLISS